MSHNLERLLSLLKVDADAIDKIREGSPYRYKSLQRLILETGQPFLNRIKSPFKGEPKSCFKNCFQARWEYPQLSYCEGFAIGDRLNLAIPHAWLINDAHEVIDPTWDENMIGCTYFGVVFDNDYVMEMTEKNRRYGILDSDYKSEYQLLLWGFPDHALRSTSSCASKVTDPFG